jgi:hypothetical protein
MPTFRAHVTIESAKPLAENDAGHPSLFVCLVLKAEILARLPLEAARLLRST